ncbi:PPP family 3-phenylpropionic acid transporter [Acetivibrio thermocellus AD2]|jgi:PPP family 3-phenylpropionic acid transporter|uniref:PPP family 3-phenylpropionic acid transporter n=1 Tax=Acetivibrio thermocellus AD2 TaxID=1138384 RepID=A0AB36TEM7_ACETH|nr:MFS transporter [Acetivibrio thermocellus]CDG35873.1 major facilitator superfamily MFS_1 [Acetivibrio thermocellus BC1]ADU74123.1 major facilitator superfamily MFS_1 [Acetivibrio thermocellus DSM 1313]ALX08061.1 major facilitator superfamily MFS_1 [Acetivibrio thermocellus AD2]ANV75808.1 major facilitator superfamily MFS_1 [Acetivibrio thermocellus DSM 2360]EIC06081.1 major facilitator superfamily MFS_1 [Acetivibrio thermocellus YS]
MILDNLKRSERYPFSFILFYSLFYMGLAVFGVFMPVYLEGLGYDNTDIGTFLSISSFVGLFAQPIWGVISDRAKSKNNVLKMLVLFSSIAIFMFRLSGNYYYIFAVMVVYAFFQTPITPIGDAITLEYITDTKWKYGPIRLAGALGYAVMAFIGGALTRKNINAIFFICFVIGIMSLITVFRMPTVKGHQSDGNKLSILEVFKNSELVLLMGFTLVIHTTMGFYNTFFPIYYKNMGADNTILGLAVFIGSASEIIFLVFGDRIIKRLGIKFTLFGAAVVAVVRWASLGLINNIFAVLALQILHGFIFIVLAYSMATYINNEMPPELKASGQTVNSVIGLGISRIIGSTGGGVISDLIGIRQVFFLNSVIVLASIVIFGAIFLVRRQKITGQ